MSGLIEEYNYAGLQCSEKKDFHGAIRWFDKALEGTPSPIILFNLANAYRGMGELQKAIEHYLKSLVYAPQYNLTRNMLLECLAPCRSLHIDGKPNIAELLVKFRDDMGWPDVLENPSSTKEFLHLYAAACRCTPDSVVLDISAGFCRNKDFFLHTQYVSIDLEVASDWNWDFSKLDLIGDALNLPIKKNSIDMILNSSSLEHYPDPFAAFAEFSRVLKPGGFLYLDAPFTHVEHQIPHDYFRFSRYGLNYLCSRYGLAPLSITPDSSYLMGGYRMLFEALSAFKNTDFVKNGLPERGKAAEEAMAYLEAKVKPLFIDIDQDPLLCPEGLSSTITNCTQYPIRYNLVAKKPGEQLPSRRYSSRAALLTEIVECPACHAAQLDWSASQCQCMSCEMIFGRNEYAIPRLVIS